MWPISSLYIDLASDIIALKSNEGGINHDLTNMQY